jgi:aryl-alcohol dehydrogenase-like predicted oxidoreductase
MQTITLGTSGRETTRLGFGCSSVMGSMGRADSLAMLEAAFDAGIRHFDVAPLYGYGQAEACLGEFLARHAGEVTVTTKFGIEAEQGKSLKSMLRGIARPVLKAVPGLKKRLQGAAGTVNASVAKAEFNAPRAKFSLERSLANLRLERIDVWLLHEAEASDLTDDALLRFMEDSVMAGRIGTFGVGSGKRKIPALVAERPAYCPVLQFEWSVMEEPVASGEFRIHHGALTENFHALHEALLADPTRSRRWSRFCDADVADASVLAKLMLKASLVCNPESVILFSSKRPENMRSNVALVNNPSLEDAALKFYSLVRAEVVATQEAAV